MDEVAKREYAVTLYGGKGQHLGTWNVSGIDEDDAWVEARALVRQQNVMLWDSAEVITIDERED